MAGPFDYLLDPSKAPQAPSEGSGTSSPFGYLLDPSKADQSPQDYTQATLTAGQNVRRPWEETAALLKEKGVNPEPHRAGYELGLARVASDKEKEGQSVLGQTVREYARSYAPFSTVIDSSRLGIGYGTNEYARAKQRFQKGEATAKDYKTIADYERGQAFDARVKSTMAGKVIEGVGTIGGKIGGEVLAGGAALRGFNAIRGAGAAAGAEGVAAGAEALAPAAETALPTLLGSSTLRAGTVGLGKSVGSFVVTPSMWLEDARQRNLQADRDVGDHKGFATAMGLGFANWLVLGRLQGRVAGDGSTAARLLGAPAIGVGEQALVDVGAEVSDKVFGSTFGTKGGLFGKVARGELGGAGEEALTQFLTFSIAAGLHESPRLYDRIFKGEKADPVDVKRASDKAEEVLGAMKDAHAELTKSMVSEGWSEPAAKERALFHLKSLSDTLKGAMGKAAFAGKDMTRADGRELFKNLPDGPIKDFAHTLLEGLPEKAPARTELGKGVEIGKGVEVGGNPAEPTPTPRVEPAKPVEPVKPAEPAAPPEPDLSKMTPRERADHLTGVTQKGYVAIQQARAALKPIVDRLALAKEGTKERDSLNAQYKSQQRVVGKMQKKYKEQLDLLDKARTEAMLAEAEAKPAAPPPEQPKRNKAGFLEVDTEPPVPFGMVRMYHGGHHVGGIGEHYSQSFAPSRDYAANWNRAPGKQVSYVDLPIGHPALHASDYSHLLPVTKKSYPRILELHGNTTLPAEIAKDRIVIKDSLVPPETAPTPPPVAEVSKLAETPAGPEIASPETNAEVSRPSEQPPTPDPERADAVQRIQAEENLPVGQVERLADEALRVGVSSADSLLARVQEAEASGGVGRAEPAVARGPSPEGLPRGPERTATPEGPTARAAGEAVPRPAGAPVRDTRSELRDNEQNHWDHLTAKERSGISRKIREAMREMGVDLDTPPWGGAHKQESPKAEEIPISEEHQRLIDEANLPPHEKAGVEAFMRGAGKLEAARAAKEAGKKVSYETLRNRVVEIIGESPAKAIEAEATDRAREFRARQARESGMAEDPDTGRMAQGPRAGQRRKPIHRSNSDRDQLYAPPEESTPPGTTTPATSTGKAEAPSSPAEVIETARKIFDTPTYTATPPGGKPSDIAYRPEPGAVVSGPMAALDVTRQLHDIAHHVEATGKFPTDPAKLPPDVRDGLAEFDYEPSRPVGEIKMKEGFAEWFKRRLTGDLSGLTDNQRAASSFAEGWLKEAKLAGKADRVKAMFSSLMAADPALRGRLITSATGEAAGADLTKGERVKDAATVAQDRFQDEVLDDLGAVRRLEASINAERKQRGEKPLSPEELGSPTFAMLMFREKAISGEFARDGVWTIKDGHKVRVGESDAQIHEGMKPEWLKPGKEGGASRLGAYAIARSALGDWSRGERTVSAEQYRTYEAAIRAERADPDFGPKAEEWSKRMTKAFLDHVVALEMVGAVPKGTADNLHKARPDYVPHYRAGKLPSGKFLKARKGSGEEIVDPILSLGTRRAATAHLMARQLKDIAADRLMSQPGMGAYALPGPEKATKAGEVELGRLKAEFERLGIDGDPMTILKDMGVERPGLIMNTPWPKGGSEATYGFVKDGVYKNYLVKDEALYNLLTNQQVDSHATASILSKMAEWGFNTPLGKVRPLGDPAWAVRQGATHLSLSFQAFNVPKDAYEFLKNTIDRSTVTSLPRAYIDSYKFLLQTLTGRFTGKKPTDALFQKFYDERGSELRQFGYERDNPSDAYAKEPTTISSLWGAFKDVLNLAGGGELAPRYLEWKTRLEQTTGKKIDHLHKEVEAADKAASEGKPYVDPIPFWAAVDAMDKAAEVTVPFGRLGTVTREANKTTPFFGPAVAGMAKAVRNWRDNWKGAAIGMAGLMTLRALHWAMFSDEKWWKRLEPHDRYTNFVVPIGGNLYRLPAPRDFEVPVGGVVTSLFDGLSGKDPQIKELLKESWGALKPPYPVTVPGNVGFDLATNTNFAGSPIVPSHMEDLPSSEKFQKYQAPYLSEQLTGGRGSISGLAKGFTPFREVHNARNGVNDFYEKLHELHGQELSAKGRGERFAGAAELSRLNHVKGLIDKVGEPLKKQKDISDADKKKIQERQLELAEAVLGKK